jgi:23S rRNA (pseudouridine1915-N3)-methyltransferase
LSGSQKPWSDTERRRIIVSEAVARERSRTDKPEEKQKQRLDTATYATPGPGKDGQRNKMIIRLIAVGKLREKYWQEGAADYSMRLRAYASLNISEVPESRLAEGASPAEEGKAVAREGDVLLSRLKGREGRVVALDRMGEPLDSLELADWLKRQIIDGQKETAFIIGGPLGLAPSVLERADLVISLSRMTFPYQMARLMLLEQIYRAFRIMRGEPYHR